MLDDGRLTDSKGRLVNFKNTVVILTSNVGSERLISMNKIGFEDNMKKADEERKQYNEVRDKVTAELQKSFKPEFLNRLDEIIIFKPLDQNSIRKIVTLLLKEAAERLSERDLSVTVDKEVYKKISKEGYDVKYGARPLRRKIQTDILNPLANAIIDGNVQEGAAIHITIKDGEYAFEVKNKKNAKRKKIREKVSV